MRSAWRVACVRIPRFPIGAVWHGRAREHPGATGVGRGEESERPALLHPAPRLADVISPASADAPNPTPSLPPHQPPSSPSPSPCWDEQLVALAESQRLRAVSAAAGRLHVRAGMTVAEARAICAALEVLPWDEVMVRAELTRATAAFLAASPQVTPATGRSGGGGVGMWWIGAGGFDGLGGERALARELSAIARRWHPRPRVAIADSCVAARAATWGMGGEGGGEGDGHPTTLPKGGY